MSTSLFKTTQTSKLQHNAFDLSHDVKLSCDMGLLIPTLAMPTIPGDRFNIGCDSLIRFAPLVAPVMHRMDVSMHYFFVPNRLLWENWMDFISNTDPATMPAPPTIFVDDSISAADFKLLDYMGIPPVPGGGQGLAINALPFAAYQKIYDEYYRDQNLIPSQPAGFELIDGDNTGQLAEIIKIKRRAWEHDYFTSALPFSQKGAAVSIPLGDVALKNNWNIGAMGSIPRFRDAGTGTSVGGSLFQAGVPNHIEVTGSAGIKQAYDPDGTLEVVPTVISDLRKAFKLQTYLELVARVGTRPIEWLQGVFGVKSKDARLQRPEYITGTKSPVIVSEVLNTSDTANAPQGNMAGHAVSVQQGRVGGYSVDEHGYIIGIMSVMPKPAYQQGIARDFLKTTDNYEHFFPQFENIGEQQILLNELYAWSGTPSDVFGYIPRYADYKFMHNRVAGDFRTSLDHWHYARQFATQPALNQTFIECNPDERIFAVTAPNVDSLYCQILHKIMAYRPMSRYGSPQL